MVNISKTKRNFIALNTLFCYTKRSSGSSDFTHSLAGALLQRISVYTGIFLYLRFV